MSQPADEALQTPIVHGLLVCRNAVPAPEGRMNLEDVLEVVAVDEMPGDAGPLAFVAFVRGIPAGQGNFAFVIQPSGSREHVTARLPLEVKVPQAFGGRQIAVQVRVPSIPITHGGWYDLVFEWEGQPLAANRFAIGQRGAGETDDA